VKKLRDIVYLFPRETLRRFFAPKSNAFALVLAFLELALYAIFMIFRVSLKRDLSDAASKSHEIKTIQGGPS